MSNSLSWAIVKNMRTKPALSEDKLIACLRIHYDLDIVSLRFLPIGYDLNAFVYEAISQEGTAYFVKIRAGAIAPQSLLVPRILIEHDIPHILASLRTTTQDLWCALDTYSVIVYPFIRGENAMVCGLTDIQWREFGSTLNIIHSGGFAARLQGLVPSETFSIPSARLVQHILVRIQEESFDSPAATYLAEFSARHRSLLDHILSRAQHLGEQLRSIPFEYVLCHADIHAANILVSEEGKIYLVDWDGPLLAPRERDLLFIVGSIIARRVELEEEAFFFQGYGNITVNRTALAYYRYERAIEDIGEIARGVFFDAD
jgi:spectinomycin phosphotransferase